MWQKIETFLMRAKEDNSEVKIFGYGSLDIDALHTPITGNKKLMTGDKKTVKPVGDGSYVVIETKRILLRRGNPRSNQDDAQQTGTGRVAEANAADLQRRAHAARERGRGNVGLEMSL